MADNANSGGPSDPAGEGFGPPPLPGSVPPPLPGAGPSPSPAEPPHFEFTQPSAAARPHGSQPGPPPFGNYHEAPRGEQITGSGAPEQSATVTKEVSCGGCGYPLRGLPTDGSCPECGKLVIESLRGDRLQFADSQWLATLAKGLRLVRLLVIASVVVTVLTFIGAIAMIGSGLIDSTTLEVIGAMLSIVLAVPTLYAWWLVTEPEPSEQLTNPIRKRRLTLRTMLIVDCGAKILQSALGLAIAAAGGGASMRGFLSPSAVTGRSGAAPAAVADAFTTGLAIASGGSALIATIAFALSFIFGCLYLRRLALRAGDMDTAGFAKTTAIVAPLCYVLLACLLGAGIVIALVLWLVLLSKAEQMVRKCLHWQERWQAELAAYKARTAAQA